MIEPALDPSNTLLIRRGVGSRREAATREEGRAYRQCVTLLNRPGGDLRPIRITH